MNAARTFDAHKNRLSGWRYTFGMNELIQLAAKTHYLPGAVNVGVLETPDGGALLIDSGSDKDHAKKILKACRAKNLEPKAILNTHSHADHYGGNAYLQETCGIPAHAPIFEETIIKYPILEPMYLYGGVRPPKSLQNKWLMGSPSGTKILNQPGIVKICDLELELIDVGGHAAQMFAVKYGDVLFATDAVFGLPTLEKHPLQFAVDIARQRESVHVIREVEARVLLPGHGDPTTDISGICHANLEAIERANRAVFAACQHPSALPEILARVCETFQISMTSLSSYVLNQTAVLAHLVELEERELIRQEIVENVLIWKILS
jgi:glyoxylase-like metal-dependent hydrolase (beta-lactamase superfamily II)